ncbi:MAG: ABC transporter substrate-binding protein [Dehalococcoidales bacterium]|nr:ABC transporter substrate-binding protein [Dehalococcoidales bacterium]
MGRKAILSIIIILTILALGCGQKAAAPGSGGEFTRLWEEPSTLDPHLSSDLYSSVILEEVFSGLVSIDRNLKVVPDLAEDWKLSADGKTYTFTLRQNAKFQSGKQVTAQDVKWSIERAADPKTQSSTVDTYLGDIVGVKEKLSGKSQQVSGVRVVDDRTVEITIDAPKAYFISKLVYPTAFVLNRANVESGREWFKTPDGTGPFKLAEYAPGDTSC